LSMKPRRVEVARLQPRCSGARGAGHSRSGWPRSHGSSGWMIGEGARHVPLLARLHSTPPASTTGTHSLRAATCLESYSRSCLLPRPRSFVRVCSRHRASVWSRGHPGCAHTRFFAAMIGLPTCEEPGREARALGTTGPIKPVGEAPSRDILPHDEAAECGFMACRWRSLTRPPPFRRGCGGSAAIPLSRRLE
jgi:hypothetical protein